MDVLLQTHEAKRVFPIPEGLKELSSDIVREVLRHQPECIHSFIAEYLETMLMVREKARDTAAVVTDIFREGYFLEDLYQTKKVTREEANYYASLIQAGWRGFVTRRKLRAYLQKKTKLIEEREAKKATKIEELLETMGITYDEATRAACVIQAAFKKNRRGKWVKNELGEEVWLEGEDVPFGQRVREGDKAKGRYDRWDKEDFGDFFELTEGGEIAHKWPSVGQLRRIPREHLLPEMDVVEFFAARDLLGKEQYSYLKKPQKGRDPRGIPIGFLIPVQQLHMGNDIQVTFVDPENNIKMGRYVYVYEHTIERQDLDRFTDVLKDHRRMDTSLKFGEEILGEFDYDPEWVVPRVLIKIMKGCLLDTDHEITFKTPVKAFEHDSDTFTYRAETAEMSLKVFNHMLKQKCMSVEHAMKDALHLKEYHRVETGRLLVVEDFETPKKIQKIVIPMETKTGELESDDMDNYEYVFVPRNYKFKFKIGPAENPMQIPMTRFQGYHSDYQGSSALENQVFILGPMLHTPYGEHINYDSPFWDEFGPEAWYQLLCTLTDKKIAKIVGTPYEEEEEEEESEMEVNLEEEEERISMVQTAKTDESETPLVGEDVQSPEMRMESHEEVQKEAPKQEEVEAQKTAPTPQEVIPEPAQPPAEERVEPAAEQTEQRTEEPPPSDGVPEPEVPKEE